MHELQLALTLEILLSYRYFLRTIWLVDTHPECDLHCSEDQQTIPGARQLKELGNSSKEVLEGSLYRANNDLKFVAAPSATHHYSVL